MSDIDMLERTIYKQDKRVAELERQRDKLREALERLAEVYDGDWDDSDLVDARAALKATEE